MMMMMMMTMMMMMMMMAAFYYLSSLFLSIASILLNDNYLIVAYHVSFVLPY